MIRILLINPNTDRAITATMRAIAAEAAPAGVTVEGFTVARGADLITDPAALAVAADAVAEAAPQIRALRPDAVIVAAFGDPGRAALAARLDIPVTGIGEAGFTAAAAGGRRFAVVTTTPDLVASITAMAAALGYADRFLGVALTDGDPVAVTGDRARLRPALDRACRRAIAEWDAEALVIGGGPLAEAARSLNFGAREVIRPIAAAVQLAVARLR